MEYPYISSVNSYEWLSEGSGGSIPPNQDILLWDRSLDPPRSVSSYVELEAVPERILNSAVYQGLVEHLTLHELCDVIDEFLRTFDSETDPDNVMSTIQAQPSLMRVLLDTKASGNFQYLRAKVFGHAVLRVAATRQYPSPDEVKLSTRLGTLYHAMTNLDYQSIHSQLCQDQDHYWGQVKLAEFDLALQLIAPSIYMDPLKLGSIIVMSASALPHPLWLLWDDKTLASITLSPLLDRISTTVVPADVQDTFAFLKERATAVVPRPNAFHYGVLGPSGLFDQRQWLQCHHTVDLKLFYQQLVPGRPPRDRFYWNSEL